MTVDRKENIPPADTDNGQAKGRRLCRAYKTQICTSFILNSACRYGDMCCFAHGLDELRQRPNPPKYKTAVCRNMVQFGHCPYGNKCDFIHSRQHDNPFPKDGDISHVPKQPSPAEPKLERKHSIGASAFSTSNSEPFGTAVNTYKPGKYLLDRPGYVQPISDMSELQYVVPLDTKQLGFGRSNTSELYGGNTDVLRGFLGQINSSCFDLDHIAPNYACSMTSQDRFAGSAAPGRGAYSFAARESGFYGFLASMENSPGKVSGR